jgi:hypothetical protein
MSDLEDSSDEGDYSTNPQNGLDKDEESDIETEITKLLTEMVNIEPLRGDREDTLEYKRLLIEAIELKRKLDPSLSFREAKNDIEKTLRQVIESSDEEEERDQIDPDLALALFDEIKDAIQEIINIDPDSKEYQDAFQEITEKEQELHVAQGNRLSFEECASLVQQKIAEARQELKNIEENHINIHAIYKDEPLYKPGKITFFRYLDLYEASDEMLSNCRHHQSIHKNDKQQMDNTIDIKYV